MQPPTPPAPATPLSPPDPADPGLVPTEAFAPLLTGRAAPRTGAELAAMQQQRKWLSDQLVSAQGRRRDVARALENAHDGANRAGLERRLEVLDRRILQLESDIGETGRLITTAPAAAVAARSATVQPGGLVLLGPNGPSANAVPALLLLMVLLQIVMLARGRVRRAAPATHPALADAGQRLARIEQAVDAIAVEVERVSEGQRFVTRVLAEQRPDPQLAAAGDTLETPGTHYRRHHG